MLQEALDCEEGSGLGVDREKSTSKRYRFSSCSLWLPTYLRK